MTHVYPPGHNPAKGALTKKQLADFEKRLRRMSAKQQTHFEWYHYADNGTWAFNVESFGSNVALARDGDAS